jgi:hypothetical protein
MITPKRSKSGLSSVRSDDVLFAVKKPEAFTSSQEGFGTETTLGFNAILGRELFTTSSKRSMTHVLIL